MSEISVPLFNLAPKREKPLSLFNPLDYLVLLHWVFFFPQALRWYAQKFGNPKYQGSRGGKAVWDTLRVDTVQRRLVMQALVSVILVTIGYALGLEIVGLRVDSVGVAFGAAIGITLGVLTSLAVNVIFGVAIGVAFGIAFGVIGSVAYSIELSVAIGVLTGTLVGVTFFRVAGGMAVSMASGMVVGTIIATIIGLVTGMPEGMVSMAGGFVAGVLATVRLIGWILVWPLSQCNWNYMWSHMIWLPLPTLQRKFELWLEQDWTAGVYNLNQFLRYTLQFIPAIAAANLVLARSLENQLLVRVSFLANGTFDWKFLRFCSTSLKYQILTRGVYELLWIPKHWRASWQAGHIAEPRLDTYARCACAGFWFWHAGEADRAAEAFSKIRTISHGQELHGIAQAIVVGKKVLSLQGLEDWLEQVIWLDELMDAELRPNALKALRLLRKVAKEAAIANHAEAILNRSTALNRAIAELETLIDFAVDNYPEPEWPLLRCIAEQWQQIVIKAGGAVGDEVLRKPVANPYQGYSGLPVTGSAFVGRRDAVRQIETFWAMAELLPVLILYGHRRMGKTSILHNLEQAMPSGTLLVYLDMHNSGFVNHTGELLLDFAKEFHSKAVAARLDAGPSPEKADYATLGDGRLALNALLARLDTQMTGRRLILAVDEFEEIEDGIIKGRIDRGVLGYLRSLNQQHRWLGLIFGGRHTLGEMCMDYQQPFLGQTEHIRVSYLCHDDAMRLIVQPHPEFTLEYAPELREEIYRLTYGQPYLVQRLCWDLVNRWNERFILEGETTPRTLELCDLETVITADFYGSAEHYFYSVWNSVAKEEMTLMTLMAQREDSWTWHELTAAGVLTDVEKPLKLLKGHDVIVEDGHGIRFASELMRRWVARQSQ